jgi:hypothetical protein
MGVGREKAAFAGIAKTELRGPLKKEFCILNSAF